MVDIIAHQPRLLLRISEAAEAVGLAKSSLYLLIRRGEIPTVRIGKAVRISTDDLRSWVETRRTRMPEARA
jgi:excisionase family DNA binding protein